MKLLLWIALIGSLYACNAKNIGEPDDSGLYIKLIGGGKGEHINDAFITAQGEVIGVGSSRSFANLNGASNYAFIFKVDANGNKVWQKAFFGNNMSQTIEANSIHPTLDGGFITATTAISTIAHNSIFPEEIYMIKLNNVGDRQMFSDTLSNIPHGLSAVSVVSWEGDSCMVLGNFKGAKVNDVETKTENFMACYNNSLGFLYQKRYSSQTYADNTPKKMRYLGGLGGKKIIIGGSVNYYPRLIRINHQLGIEWDYSYKSLGNGSIYDAKLVGSNIVATGVTSSNTPFLLLVTWAGELIWHKSIAVANITQINSVEATQDGGFVLVGSLQLTEGEFKHTNIWVGKLNASGELEWEKNFGGRKNDVGKCVRTMQDGSLVVLGDVGYEESMMVGLIRMDKNGNLLK